MKKTFVILTIFAAFLFFTFSSCRKQEGQGGNASIRGRIHSKLYNKSFTVLLSEYDVPEYDVYIIYGDDFSYSDRTRTDYKGDFEFPYLYKGDYRVYAISLDSTMNDSLYPSGKYPAYKDVTILKNKEIKDVGVINIYEN
jgi:hypothetical protein